LSDFSESTPPPAARGHPGPGRIALSHDLSELLIELAIALHRFGMYPPGHPELERAASGVALRLDGVLTSRGALSFGVARRQLVIEGVATDTDHPVLSSLATRLHRHHVGAVTFRRGLTPGEVSELLRALGAEPREDDGSPAALPRWPSIDLYPLTYEQLQLVQEEGGEGVARDRRDGRAAQLWIGLARAALAEEQGEAPGEVDAEPAIVAEAINTRPGAPAYDQVIVGHLLQLAEELRAGETRATAGVRRRMARLVAALDPAALKRLVDMGGDLSQRKRFTLDVARGFSAEAVVEVVRAAGEASNRTVSESLLRVLNKLAVQARDEDSNVGRVADHELREHVVELVNGWSEDDPNPGAYAEALTFLARDTLAPGASPRRFAGAESVRIVQMALEAGIQGASVDGAVDAGVEEGRVGELMDLLAALPVGEAGPSAVWARLGRPETILRLLRAETVDRAALAAIVERMGTAAAEPLLDELMGSAAAPARAVALDLLAGLGPAVGPLAAGRMADARDDALPRVLELMRRVGHVPARPPIPPLLRHDDAPVRRAALELLLESPADRDRSLCVALTDADAENVRVALGAAMYGYPAAAVPLLVRCTRDATLPPEVRAQAVRAIREDRTPSVLAALIGLCAPGRTLFGRPRLAAPTPAVVEAVAALADGWPTERRAAAIVARAARSREPALRAAATGASHLLVAER
jgi:hypothetical protein